MMYHWISFGGGNCFFIICLCILEFGSKRGLVFMWGQLVMSMWLIEVNFLMMDWAVDWGVWVNLVVWGLMMSFNVMWSSIDIVCWVSSVMWFSMAVESCVMWSFVVRSCMV